MTNLIKPDWPAPKNVKAYQTTRKASLSTEHSSPQWLKQVHGNRVINIATEKSNEPEADASFSAESGLVCAVKTADCLPILICDQEGTMVAAIHGGWKGILAGIIEITVRALPTDSKNLLVWLGAAIGPNKFEVGEDVYSIFINYDENSKTCFTPKNIEAGQEKKWLANIYELAKQRLLTCGINKIYGGDYCTYSQKDLFFSYRREADQAGRMASLIWLE